MSEIHYPKGVTPIAAATKVTPKKKTSPKLRVAAGNRGMSFEEAINASNAYYAEKGLCLITKRPTPIRVSKVDYSHGAKITAAFYEKQSTTDYNGVYDGHYSDFEAKETRAKASFPLNNIPKQQIEHLKSVLSQKGIAFFLIRIVAEGKVYLLPAEYVILFYEKRERASIPFASIKEHGFPVPEGYRPRYDFLPVVKDVFLK